MAIGFVNNVELYPKNCGRKILPNWDICSCTRNIRANDSQHFISESLVKHWMNLEMNKDVILVAILARPFTRSMTI